MADASNEHSEGGAARCRNAHADGLRMPETGEYEFAAEEFPLFPRGFLARRQDEYLETATASCGCEF